MKNGPSESEKKSFIHVLRKLAHATNHHSCHELIVSVIILVVGDGPKRMKSVSNNPIDLNANNTTTSQQINTPMDMRLSSNTISSKEAAICYSAASNVLCTTGTENQKTDIFDSLYGVSVLG